MSELNLSTYMKKYSNDAKMEKIIPIVMSYTRT
jgi:hypothetical protein